MVLGLGRFLVMVALACASARYQWLGMTFEQHFSREMGGGF